MEQPYQCHTCGVSYSTAGGLNGHRNSIAHKESERQQVAQVALAGVTAARVMATVAWQQLPSVAANVVLWPSQFGMQSTTGEKRKRDDDEHTKGKKWRRGCGKRNRKKVYEDGDDARRPANRGAENRTHYSPILKLAVIRRIDALNADNQPAAVTKAAEEFKIPCTTAQHWVEPKTRCKIMQDASTVEAVSIIKNV